MKYSPKQVFIKENDNYIEITNAEHEKRKATDEQYAKRLFVPLHGVLMEVDEEFYKDFYRQKDRDDYLTWRTKNMDISYNEYDSEECSGEDMLVDPDEDVATQVTDKLMAEHIRYVVSLLPSDERELIEAIYFNGYTERSYADEKGVFRNAIHKKKVRILEKLKNFLENS